MITDQWKPGTNADIEHIAIASSIDLLLIAPATANTLGKFAHGIADDFLTSMYLATTAPVLRRAGDEHATCSRTRRWSRTCDCSRRAACASSSRAPGYLACGWIGKGRLAEPQDVVADVRAGAAAAGDARSAAGGCW